MNKSVLILSLLAAGALPGLSGTGPIAINNYSFEANRSTSGTGAFGSGDLQDLGLSSPTGWSVIATDNTAASNNGQEIAFGWLNLTPQDPVSEPPQPQALSLMAGAAIGQVTTMTWSSLIEGDTLTLSIATGDRNVNAPSGTPRWADNSFFGLSDGLATRLGAPPTTPDNTAASVTAWLGQQVTQTFVASPPQGYKTGDMWAGDVTLTYVVTAADLNRTGNVGVFIASLGDRDGTGYGTIATTRQSFWDNVRLTLTTARPTVGAFTVTPSAIAAGASATLHWWVNDADTVTINNGIGVVSAFASQSVSPLSTTTYTLTASNSFGLTSQSVTLTVIPPGPFRYYRFMPTKDRAGGTPPGQGGEDFQIAEFQLVLNGNWVQCPMGGVSSPGASRPVTDGEGAQKANDNRPIFVAAYQPGDTSQGDTKWNDPGMPPLIYDFGTVQDVSGYRICTANDSDNRDPVSWRVEGSHDGVNWLLIDERTDYPTTTDRLTYLEDFALPPWSTGPAANFSASPAEIYRGSSSTLTWNVSGATSITINHGIGAVAATGSLNVAPTTTTTYLLIATNDSGTTIKSATVTVLQPGPFRYYRFVPVTLRGGENTVQLCEFQMLLNGTRVPAVTVSNPGGSNPPNAGEGAEKANDNLPATSGGSPDTKWLDDNKQSLVYDFATTQDVTGYRWCTGNDSDDRDPVTWLVQGSHDNALWQTLDGKTNYTVPTARKTYLSDFPLAPFGNGPRGSFTAGPSTIVVGSASTLSWNLTNATGISIDQGIGAVAASGSLSVSPASTTTYTLTATNAAGITTKSVTVTVVLGLPVDYDFDDATFQGWTDESLGNTGTQGWSPTTGHGGTQAGPNAIRAQFHDSPHPTMILRSPEFTLNGSGDMSAWIAGGDGIGTLTGTQVSALPANSADQGFMGIALRNQNNGTYVLSAHKTIGDGDSYEKLVFTAAQLATLNQNATYTLDLVDACHGGWGWVAMDTVSIPGTLGSGPTDVPVIFSFIATPAQIMLGQSSSLFWSVSNATSVSINNGVGTVAATGSTSVSPTNTTTYTLTAIGSGGTSTAPATVVVFLGALQGRTYDTIAGDSYLDPISNLIAQTPSATFEQLGDIAYEDNFVGNSELPGITGANDFSILWLGWFDVRVDGPGSYTFGTESDDGSVIYLDRNLDGDFSDPGEQIVNNNGVHPKSAVTGSVDLQMDEVRIAIGFYQGGGGAAMYAGFGKGDNLAYASLAPINGTSGHFKATNSLPLPPVITFTANPPGILAGQSSTLSWTVLNATNVSIDHGLGTVAASGSQPVTPASTTTYTLTANGAGGTRTATATVTIVAPGPYRYYRFAPTQLRDAGAANSVQIAEFQLLSGGVRIAGATASNPGGNSPGDESPAQANDNDLNTKWLDFAKWIPLVLDFGATTPVGGYRWATADDADERDPVGWRVDGSHDGTAWVTLDEYSNYATPTARNTYLSDFSLTAVPPFSVTAISLSPTHVMLTWQSVPSATYTISAGANLGDPNGWSPVAQNLPSAGAVTTYSVPRSGGVKFYRVQGSR
jgi:hypothetical protein